MAINKSRVLLGGFAGGVVWTIVSFLMNIPMMPRYLAAQNAGLFLKTPRYPGFTAQWIIMLFVLAIVTSYLYAAARSTLGPGPRTAFKVGAIVGFASGFPISFANATWSAIDRTFPLAWMLELWAGAILATLVAGFIYKEADTKKAARAAA